MTRLTTRYSGLSIYLKLIPFLVLYTALCIALSQNIQVGDEDRYLEFARNLIKGHYSPPYPEINLWNGPGYPIVIAPFLLLKLPLIAIRLLNGLFLYFSLIISYKTFVTYSSQKNALLFTLLLGLYFPIFEMLPMILTESLAWFLISLICYLFTKNFRHKYVIWKLIVLTAFAIAYLVMTKVIFGYVVMIMFFVSAGLLLVPGFRIAAKKAVLIFSISFLFCLPWLIYTYSLTDKLFYWTNSASMSLYSMSTPFEKELGDWRSFDELNADPDHKAFIDSILKLNNIQKDEAFNSAAIRNIKNNPQKFFSNWLANVGRLLFSYPYSDTPQTIKSYFTIVPNLFIIFCILLSFIAGITNYKKIPFELFLLLLFILIYLFGSSLVSSYRRMFYITMPFWFYFFSYIINNIISIRIKRL